MEYQITESIIDKKVIESLRKLNYRIELECWYGMPVNNLYKSLGMKEIKTRYMLNWFI